MSLIRQLSKKYVKADIINDSGEELIKLATALSKHANNLISIGKAWSKTDENDIKQMVRHEGVAKLQIDDVMKIAKTLNAEFGRGR